MILMLSWEDVDVLKVQLVLQHNQKTQDLQAKQGRPDNLGTAAML
jgi:hypothetical protein